MAGGTANLVPHLMDDIVCLCVCVCVCVLLVLGAAFHHLGFFPLILWCHMIVAWCWALALITLDVVVVLVGMPRSSLLWFALPHEVPGHGTGLVVGVCRMLMLVVRCSAGAVVEAGGKSLRVWVGVVIIPPASGSVAAEGGLPSSSRPRPAVQLRASLFVKLFFCFSR